ncbi:MAG: PAS domain-containing sensor histidine kinase [Limisphaerales bacterium]
MRIIGLLVGGGGAFFPVFAEPLPTPLTTAAEVRALSPEEAATARRVRLRGVVTVAEPALYLWFLQDETAGIYLQIRAGVPPLRGGQVIEVDGYTEPGEYAPIVNAERAVILGEAPLPPARPVTYEQLASGREDSQFVEITGIVRAVSVDTNNALTTLELAAGGGRLRVYARRLPEPAADELVDARVRVRGVCTTQFNQQRQLFAIRLIVPRPEDLLLEERPPADPFSVPTQSIGSLLRFTPQGNYGRRVKVTGRVTHYQPGVALFIEEENSGLKVLTREQTPLRLGERVEVLGFTAQGQYTPVLEDAVFRKIAPGLPAEPVEVTVDEALSGAYDSRLVRLRANVLDRARQSREQFVVLEADKFIFQAHLTIPENLDAFAGLQNGSEVAVTGICLIEPGQWRAGKQWRAKSFSLLLRTPTDVRVLAAPPWWTLRKLLWILGLLVLVVVAALAWVGVLRRRVREQTRIIRQQLETEAGLKERYFDLFENANDMVFTHDLDGRLTSINRAGERLLQRGRDRLLGLNLVDLVAEDQREAARQWLQQVVQGAEPPAAELDFVNATGHRVKLEISSRLIESAGKPLEVEGVARDITERRRLERELLEISNREQRRIGHDLHDGVCQQLAAIAYRLDILGDQLAAKGAAEAREAEKIGTLINEATAQARSVARGLFPVRLEENGLVSALEELAATSSQRFRTVCHFQPPAQPLTVDSEAALHLYYIAQEAILNAVRHGHPARVELALQNDSQQARLIVRDNGTGFQPGSPRSGMGIRIMRYRAKVIGATLDVHSRPGEGTEVICAFTPAQPGPR